MFYRIVYNSLLPIVYISLRLLAIVNRSMAYFFRNREHWRKQAQHIRDLAGDTPLWVLHGASVGELMQIAAVKYEIESNFRKSINGGSLPYFLITYFSNSAQTFVEKQFMQNDANKAISCMALPIDMPWIMKNYLQIINPRLFIAASYDIWPNLTWNLKKRGVVIALVSAILSSNTKRSWGPLAGFYAYVYSHLDLVECCDVQTQNRFQRLLANHKVDIQCSGDTRCDSIQIALERRQSNIEQNLDLVRQWLGHGLEKGLKKENKYQIGKAKEPQLLIVASVYRDCDSIIIPAITQMLKTERNDVRVLYVPHKVDAKRVVEIGDALARQRLKYQIFSDLGKASAKWQPILVIDILGLLLHLYSMAHLAFIGGSFHYKIHNVYEPAASGLAICFGPRYHNAAEAIRLLELGGAYSVQNSEQFFSWWQNRLEDRALALREGEINRQEFQRNIGASNKVVQNILALTQGKGEI